MTANPMQAITQLRFLGYSVTLSGGSLKLIYRGDGSPPKERIAPLIEILKARKEEILNDSHFLIDQTMQEINEGWISGTLPWMKRECPQECEMMLSLEERINSSALRTDIEALKHVLAVYKTLMLSVITKFSSHKGEIQA